MISTRPADAGADDTPSWSFTGEPGATFECRVERGATVVDDWAACPTPSPHDLTAEADGDYTFSVRARRRRRQPRPVGDRRLHARPRRPRGAGDHRLARRRGQRRRRPAWSFAGEAGASFECRLERADLTAVDDWAACTSPRAARPRRGDRRDVHLPRRGDRRRRQPQRRERRPPTSSTRRRPPRPPSAPGPPAVSADPSPAWSFTGEPGAGFECRLDRGATVVVGWAPCASPESFDLERRGRRDRTPSASAPSTPRATWAPRRPPPSSSTAPRPAAPTITAGPAADSSDATPTYTFTVEAGSGAECRLERGATVVDDWAACVEPAHATTSRSSPTAPTRSAPAPSTAPATRAPRRRWSHTLDRARSRGAHDHRAARRVLHRRHALLRVHRRGRRHVRVPPRARGDDVSAWAPCSTPAVVRPLRRGRRHVHVHRPRQRRRRQHEHGRHARRTTSTAPRPRPRSITSGPAAVSPDATPTYGFTIEAGAAATCRLERGATVVSDWAACTSPHTEDLVAPARRHVHVPRARDRHRRQHRGGGDARLRPRPQRARGAGDHGGADRRPAGRHADVRVDGGDRVRRASAASSAAATVVADWAACSTPHTPDLSASPTGPTRSACAPSTPPATPAPTPRARTRSTAPRRPRRRSPAARARTPPTTRRPSRSRARRARPSPAAWSAGATIVSGWAIVHEPDGLRSARPSPTAPTPSACARPTRRATPARRRRAPSRSTGPSRPPPRSTRAPATTATTARRSGRSRRRRSTDPSSAACGAGRPSSRTGPRA